MLYLLIEQGDKSKTPLGAQGIVGSGQKQVPLVLYTSGAAWNLIPITPS